MPVLQATLGTTREGMCPLVVSDDLGEDVGRIDFPLDHVALAARRVGARSASQLWGRAADAAWQLAGGAALPEHAWETIRKAAERVLDRLPSTASTPVPIDVVSSRHEGDWVLQATTDRVITRFEVDTYLPQPITPTYSWRTRHCSDIAVGDRVHVFGELDGELLDISSHRHSGGGGYVIRVRTADGRVIHRRTRAVKHAPQRDVIVTKGQAVHTFAAATEALDSSGPYRYGVALLALVHAGCSCEKEATEQIDPAPR